MRAESKKEIALLCLTIEMSSSTNDSSAAKIKNAASLLVKGGTLTGDPCEQCGGVLIRFKDKTTCISCGAETGSVVVSGAQEKKDSDEARPPSTDLSSCAQLIEKKIIRLTSELASEEDILLQKQKAELLEGYLVILERLRNMAS